MAQKLPVMPVWVSDFIGSSRVQEMSGFGQGVYLLLLVHEWNLKGSLLPSKNCQLRRLLKLTSRQWKSVEKEVLQFFEKKDGRLYNERLEQLLRKEMEYQKRRRKKAKGAAKARWE